MTEANETENAVAVVIADYKKAIAASRAQHEKLIADVCSQITSVVYDKSESFLSFIDNLSANLGASAANQCARAADQDDAIGQLEEYVSDSISSDALALAEALVEAEGPEGAQKLLRKIVSESPRK